MAYLNRKIAAEEELWNVSLLPIAGARPSQDPPQGPSPRGGLSLRAPAVLSVSDSAHGSRAGLDQAA